MKNIALILAATALLLTTTSWDVLSWATDSIEEASATKTKKTIKLKSFDELSVSRGLKVHYTPGPGQPVIKITAPENYHQYIKLTNANDELTISLTPRNVNNLSEFFTIELTGGCPDEIESNSAAAIIIDKFVAGANLELTASSASSIACGSVTVTNTLECSTSSGAGIIVSAVKAPKIDVETSSGASVSLAGVDCTALQARCSSGSGATLSGSSTTVALKASSGAGIYAGELKAREGSAEANSGAMINCNIKKTGKLSGTSGAGVINK